MPTIFKASCIIAAAILCAVPARTGYGQDLSSEQVRGFVAATRDYAVMHQRLEAQIGPIEITTSIADINRKIEQLAAAIRAERPDAKQGDLFTPALGFEIKAAIGEALRASDVTAADVIDAGRVDGIDYQRINLRVNGTFPWVLGAAMFPCLIEALPPLPQELQYRIVGVDLILVDVHASLIVDILPSALAAMTVRQSRMEGALP